MERPTGITVIAWLGIIGGVLWLLSGCALLAIFVLSGMSGSAEAPNDGLLSGAMGICLFAALAIGAVIYIMIGWGLLQLNSWARTLLIVFSAIGLIFFPVGTVINGIIIWYCYQPEVKTAFGVY